MSGVSMCWVVQVGCREVGAWWLPAEGIRASQGTFSSSNWFLVKFLTFNYFYGPYLICRCFCTFTRRNSTPLSYFFHQNNSSSCYSI